MISEICFHCLSFTSGKGLVPLNTGIQHTLNKIQYFKYYGMWYVKLPQRFDVIGGVSDWDADFYLCIWETSHLRNETEPDGALRSHTDCLVPQSVWRGAKDKAETPARLFRPQPPAPHPPEQIYNSTAASQRSCSLWKYDKHYLSFGILHHATW